MAYKAAQKKRRKSKKLGKKQALIATIQLLEGLESWTDKLNVLQCAAAYFDIKQL